MRLTELLEQFVQEAVRVPSFIEHLRTGLSYARSDQFAEARQIVDDWLEDTELRMGNLLAPGHVNRIERFVSREWPAMLEQYRGNKTMALIAMNNLLDARFNELREAANVSSNKLLRSYIREVLGSGNPRQTGKDVPSSNLYALGDEIQPAPIRGSTGDSVLQDEEAAEEQRAQSTKQAACCLILSDDGKVLAVSRKDDPSAFGLPGGKVDFPETPEQAAARELQEETGLTATALHQVFFRHDPDGYDVFTFACEVEGQINTDESGVIRWVTPEVLFAGPFGDYNRALWKRLGLPISTKC